MATSKIMLLLLLIQCIVFTGSSRRLKNTNINIDNTFNVINFGAIGDGQKDDSKMFKHAWDAACDSSAPSPTFLVPQGKTYLLQPLTFNGKHCNSNNITLQCIKPRIHDTRYMSFVLARNCFLYICFIDGRIIAPTKPSAWDCETNCNHWIGFENFDGLHIQGSGTVNGQGDKWWKLSCKDNEKSCQHRKPTGFMIGHSKNVDIKGLTFEDSPQMHIAFESSTLVHATELTIRAPGHSPNTDGIHIQRSTNVSIDNSTIQTGDDCISIGNESKYINISNIECGPGHGISIGSLGIMGKTEEVEFVHGGHGHARNIKFEDITSHSSTRPIVIDQYYCPHKQCKNQTSAVEISNIAYENINGTSHKEIAVQLLCSEFIPCKNITMKDINLIYEKHKDKTSSYCLNARGLRNGRVHPSVFCLQQEDNF
ncbi:putative polygalacturonase isoform X1 [Gossypium australe]|uniref:Putative polygalacturonase isoform X1 n=1 Tax=Gossypium australe TaxID=47621 RepID=A0A5B6UGG4_9ROSI|nr:putative polygalacturonase isoform X1 [Gossypium australe]